MYVVTIAWNDRDVVLPSNFHSFFSVLGEFVVGKRYDAFVCRSMCLYALEGNHFTIPPPSKFSVERVTGQNDFRVYPCLTVICD